jgi:hypothetical protein
VLTVSLHVETASRSFREPSAAADVEVSMSNILLLVLGLASAEFLGQAPRQPTPHAAAPHYRYFKEDHLTGAEYLWLRDNGDYTIVSREHMGIFQLEGGRWTKHGSRLTFTPTRKSGGRPLKAYAATEVTHGKHTFLAMEPDDPALTIPAAETLKELKAAPDALPLYVFFETDRTTCESETQQPYPFRFTRPK